MSSAMTCAVMLPTHNRLEDLRRTLAAVRTLDPAPDEILITADGCTDGTVDFLRHEWPHAHVFIHEHGRGSTASRDAMMRAARSDLVLSLDDDSYPLESDALGRLRTIFTEWPRVAVASFPQRSDEHPASLTAADFGAAHFAGTYVNCACAFRRQVLLDLGGHYAPFWNAYDEPDFAVRCTAAGWQVRFDPRITIRHHYSGVNRDERRVHQMHARNELWSVVLRCPLPQLFAVAAFRTARQLGYACRRGPGWAMREPQWWWAALRGLPAALARRRTVPWGAYWAWMRLVRSTVATEQEWKALCQHAPD